MLVEVHISSKVGHYRKVPNAECVQMNDGENDDRRVGSTMLCELAARFENNVAQVCLRHFYYDQARPGPRRPALMGRVVPLRLAAATCARRAVSAVSARKLWIAATVETLLFSHSWPT